MRLLMGIPDPGSLGGPAACEPPFIDALRREGIEVDEEVYVYGEKLSPPTPWQRVNRVLEAAFRIRRKLKSGTFDLVHLNSSFDRRAIWRDVLTLSIIGRRSKVFFKFHGGDADLLKTDKPVLKSMVGRLLTQADGFGVLSSEEKANFVNAGWPESKFFVIKNVTERTFPQPSSDFLSTRGLSPTIPALLFIARFIPAKGLLDVIRACALLRDEGRKFVLFCVGDGPSRAEAEAEVKKLGLGDFIRFDGLIAEAETAEFYANSTALVFPTYHYEGFPMSIFFGVTAGLPIVTTRIRAAADYLTEPENCLWVEPKNPVMLAEKIARLLDDADLRHSMSNANRALSRKFTSEVVAKEYLDVYQRVIGTN